MTEPDTMSEAVVVPRPSTVNPVVMTHTERPDMTDMPVVLAQGRHPMVRFAAPGEAMDRMVVRAVVPPSSASMVSGTGMVPGATMMPAMPDPMCVAVPVIPMVPAVVMATVVVMVTAPSFGLGSHPEHQGNQHPERKNSTQHQQNPGQCRAVLA